MNILVLSLNYAPEQTGFAPHATSACEHFAARGHQVTVITGFPFAPFWKRFPEFRGRFMTRESRHAVDVWRVTHFIPRRAGSMSQRVLMEGTFCLSALMALSRARARPDVVLYVGAQPAIGMTARWLARLAGVPYVVNIQDLAAQAAADVGIVKARGLMRAMGRFEFAAYRRAAGAMVLCQAFVDALVADGFPIAHIRLIRSPIDVEGIQPRPADPDFRSRIGLTADDFVILHAGSMGLKQGLSNVIEAARTLTVEAPLVKWVLVGDGEAAAGLRARVDQYRLQDTVRFLPLQPEEMMSTMFAAADVLLLNQVSAVKDTVIPSKLLTYMAAGKPVLAAINAESQGAAILRESEGGLVVRPDDPAALAEGARAMLATDAHAAMGRRNRMFAERHFDRRRIVEAQEQFLVQCVARTAGSLS